MKCPTVINSAVVGVKHGAILLISLCLVAWLVCVECRNIMRELDEEGEL